MRFDGTGTLKNGVLQYPRITTVIEVTGVAPLTNHCTSLTSSVDLDPPGYMHSGTCMISVNQDYHYPFR
jgi:hypothetical protein